MKLSEKFEFGKFDVTEIAKKYRDSPRFLNVSLHSEFQLILHGNAHDVCISAVSPKPENKSAEIRVKKPLELLKSIHDTSQHILGIALSFPFVMEDTLYHERFERSSYRIEVATEYRRNGIGTLLRNIKETISGVLAQEFTYNLSTIYFLVKRGYAPFGTVEFNKRTIGFEIQPMQEGAIERLAEEVFLGIHENRLNRDYHVPLALERHPKKAEIFLNQITIYERFSF